MKLLDLGQLYFSKICGWGQCCIYSESFVLIKFFCLCLFVWLVLLSILFLVKEEILQMKSCTEMLRISEICSAHSKSGSSQGQHWNLSGTPVGLTYSKKQSITLTRKNSTYVPPVCGIWDQWELYAALLDLSRAAEIVCVVWIPRYVLRGDCPQDVDCCLSSTEGKQKKKTEILIHRGTEGMTSKVSRKSNKRKKEKKSSTNNESRRSFHYDSNES